MKTKLKRRLLLAAALLGAVGCGGNDGSGAAVTYVYDSARPVKVTAQTCILVRGPIQVGNGSMHYAIDDVGAGTDAIEAVIISDSYFSSEECRFKKDQTIVDVSVSGSSSGDPRVVADVYDFIITCGNAGGVDCSFNLTWSATY